jgi:hypothetical protein
VLEGPTTAVRVEPDLISTRRADERALSTPNNTVLSSSVCLPEDIGGSDPEQSYAVPVGISLHEVPLKSVSAPSIKRLNLYARSAATESAA